MISFHWESIENSQQGNDKNKGQVRSRLAVNVTMIMKKRSESGQRRRVPGEKRASHNLHKSTCVQRNPPETVAPQSPGVRICLEYIKKGSLP